MVLGPGPEEVREGLQRCRLVVKFEVGEDVVADAVHDLPFVVSKASENCKIPALVIVSGYLKRLFLWWTKLWLIPIIPMRLMALKTAKT